MFVYYVVIQVDSTVIFVGVGGVAKLEFSDAVVLDLIDGEFAFGYVLFLFSISAVDLHPYFFVNVMNTEALRWDIEFFPIRITGLHDFLRLVDGCL